MKRTSILKLAVVLPALILCVCALTAAAFAVGMPLTIIGHVTVNGTAMGGVSVSAGDSHASTDDSGYYQIVPSVDNGSSVTVTADYQGHTASGTATQQGQDNVTVDLSITYTTSTPTPVPVVRDRSVSLTPGTFNVSTHEHGTKFPINRLTALGALDASGIGYSASDSWWNLYGDIYMDSIDGQHDNPPAGWMFAVNGNVPMNGANNVVINDGDTVTWFYSEDMNSKPGNSQHVVNIHVHVAEPAATATPTPTPTPLPPTPTSNGNGMIFSISTHGNIQANNTTTTLDFGAVRLSIKNGTSISSSAGAAIKNITITKNNTTFFPDKDLAVCEVYGIEPFGAVFDPPASITFAMNESESMDGLYIVYYDENASKWVHAGNQTVAGHNITANIGDLAYYTVMKDRPQSAAGSSATPAPPATNSGNGGQLPVAVAIVMMAFLAIAIFAVFYRKK